MLWREQLAQRRGSTGNGRLVHLLTCSICLFFLPEWVSGASSVTVPHSNTQRQFPSSRRILWGAANYERENGTTTSAARKRTDHSCQRAFSSISMTRTWAGLEDCALKNSWPHVVFFWVGASCCRKTGISGSLAKLFDPLFLSSNISLFILLVLTPISLSIANTHVQRLLSTCVESPVHN